MTTKYHLLRRSKLRPNLPVGAIVYASYANHDLAAYDTRDQGYPCVIVTCDPKGGSPSFAVPAADLARIVEAPALPVDEHVPVVGFETRDTNEVQ